MDINQTLKNELKNLRLSGILDTLPERLSFAKQSKLTYQDFLELVLQDERERRDARKLMTRLRQAQFDSQQTIENFNWDTPVTFDRERVKSLVNLSFLERKEDILLLGPVGVGKTFVASAIGHAACRIGKKVLLMRADTMFKKLYQSRADNSTERELRKLLAPDLLIIDDFGLRQLDNTQSSDLYEIIVERHRRSSTIVTSNRSIEEWMALFADPILAQSAIDRLAHNAHQIVMDGPSYRQQQGPNKISATKKGGKKH